MTSRRSKKTSKLIHSIPEDSTDKRGKKEPDEKKNLPDKQVKNSIDELGHIKYE